MTYNDNTIAAFNMLANTLPNFGIRVPGFGETMLVYIKPGNKCFQMTLDSIHRLVEWAWIEHDIRLDKVGLAQTLRDVAEVLDPPPIYTSVKAAAAAAAAAAANM